MRITSRSALAVLLRNFAGALLLSLGTAAAASDPRQPTGKWVVDFDDTQCVASRNFGTAEKPLFLALKAPPLAKIIQLAVVRTGSGGAPSQHDASVHWQGGTEIETTVLSYNPTKDRRVHLINIPVEQFASASKAGWIRIRASNALEESFQLTAMSQLLQTLGTCVTDLERAWSQGTAGPEGDLRSLFNWQDYPTVALNKDQQGSVRVVLLVDERGKVAECTITETSGVAALDAQACAVIKQRAKLKPGRDASNKPVRSLFHQRMTWRIEGI